MIVLKEIDETPVSAVRDSHDASTSPHNQNNI